MIADRIIETANLMDLSIGHPPNEDQPGGASFKGEQGRYMADASDSLEPAGFGWQRG
jgi:hypothetical protein